MMTVCLRFPYRTCKRSNRLYFKAVKDTFLIADSCWHQETFKERLYPSELTYLIHHNKGRI